MSDSGAPPPPPPPGIPPPISNPNDNENARIQGAVIAVTALALATVAARFYVRTVMIRNLGWDVRLSSNRTDTMDGRRIANIFVNRTP
jgi:hypothetical protein